MRGTGVVHIRKVLQDSLWVIVTRNLHMKVFWFPLNCKRVEHHAKFP
jgi:hypothetical protein